MDKKTKSAHRRGTNKSKRKSYENYKIEKINRQKLKNAPYNPRIISKKNILNLKLFIKKYGLLAPAAIWNKNTGNIVGGHQRISQLDTLYKTKDYEVTVCIVELSEEEEVKANIKLNNPNLQGTYDADLLGEIIMSYPDLDLKNDFMFEQEDIDFMFPEESPIFQPEMIESNELQPDIDKILKIKEKKKEYNKKVKEQNDNGESDNMTEKDDYFVTIVFNNNSEKWEFMKKLKQPKNSKYIKGSLFDE
jgi:hypothetical protein